MFPHPKAPWLTGVAVLTRAANGRARTEDDLSPATAE
jgi:hypothetical protein